MHILLDFDSTLAHTFGAQLRELNKKFGKNYKPSMFVDWRSEEVLTEEEANFIWGPECFLNKDFQLKARPVEGAIYSVMEMIAEGHEFLIASDRPQELYDVTRQWLNDRGLANIKLLLTTHSNSLANDKGNDTMTKLRVINEYGITVAVDDAPHHAIEFSELPVMEEIYLLTYPHNKTIKGDKIIRCRNWNDLTTKFHQRHPYFTRTVTGRLSTSKLLVSAVPQ